MTITLYTVGTLVKELEAGHGKIRHWLEKADPKLGYVEPYAVVPKANKGEQVLIKLWHEDQLPAIRDGYAEYLKLLISEKVAAQTRRKERMAVFNKQYYAANRERIQTRNLIKEAEDAKKRIKKRSQQEIEDAKQLEIDAAFDAEQFIQQEQREREERAMQFLLEKNLV